MILNLIHISKYLNPHYVPHYSAFSRAIFGAFDFAQPLTLCFVEEKNTWNDMRTSNMSYIFEQTILLKLP